MNYKQRIVLIIGAAALLYFLFASPKISIVKGTYVIPPPDKENIARMTDLRTSMTRAVAVLGATILVLIALKDKGKPRILSTVDRNTVVAGCQESENGAVKKDVIAKIIRFLKDFF